MSILNTHHGWQRPSQPQETYSCGRTMILARLSSPDRRGHQLKARTENYIIEFTALEGRLFLITKALTFAIKTSWIVRPMDRRVIFLRIITERHDFRENLMNFRRIWIWSAAFDSWLACLLLNELFSQSFFSLNDHQEYFLVQPSSRRHRP